MKISMQMFYQRPFILIVTPKDFVHRWKVILTIYARGIDPYPYMSLKYCFVNGFLEKYHSSKLRGRIFFTDARWTFSVISSTKLYRDGSRGESRHLGNSLVFYCSIAFILNGQGCLRFSILLSIPPTGSAPWPLPTQILPRDCLSVHNYSAFFL